MTAADLRRIEDAGGDVHAILARYLAGFAGPPEAAEARHRFFRLHLDWLTGVFERAQEAGQAGTRLVPEASAMVLLARLEAAPRDGRGPAAELLAGLMA